ncbi:glutaredoxin [Endozoicomonas elysicola]|uniref:Glutaredoxin n=1 Tax=Endozoicomonas elysicola TaxID=305900 RepID=A0A081KG31_9GAMM|nr:glutaredoxin [Endozoicomonas elysicola]
MFKLKTVMLFLLALFVYQKWDLINNYFNPPPDFSVQHGGKVILYSAEWCGYCKETRKLLEHQNIPFYEYDIEKSAEGFKQFKRLKGKGVPLVFIGGEVVRGYDPSQILRLANEH